MLTEPLEEEISLVGRHLEVLRSVGEEGPIGIRRLAEETGLTKSKVRYSLRVLEREGFVEPSKQGAKVSGRDPGVIEGELEERLEELKGLMEEL